MTDPWTDATAERWDRRAAAARALAAGYSPGKAKLDDILLRLLLDAEDTAVSCDAAEALLSVGTADAAFLVFAALGKADDDTRVKLYDTVWGAAVAGLPLRAWAEQALTHPDSDVRRGGEWGIYLLTARVPPSPDAKFDLDCRDLDQVRRRVVAPVVASLLRPGELDGLELRAGPPTGIAPQLRDDDPEVWLILVAGGEVFRGRIAKMTAEPWDAEDVAGELSNALSEWMCETHFAWGEWREGVYEIPPPSTV